ncbi:MAG: TonB-dependent receptor plug domain-containing protein [Burkholderiales bacterium]|nr:TonB-dependent receptor plug domain-containing protein [Burkholderiales bacterium]
MRRRHTTVLLGASDAASQGVIRAALLKSRPALRPGEVLAFVPGVIVTQHSGGGKANQYFLRGFNLDHGTDFATSLNGMPVNMPSHGHGQGYTDLNFLIPELVQRIEYRKGPYFARSGDFASAGAADIVYRRQLDTPFALLGLGEKGYRRALAGGSATVGDGLTLLAAFEAMGNDGPWQQPEALRKRNGVLTLSGGTAAQAWSASLLGYRARWTATDQVPQRLIDAGQHNGLPFGRFDTLDASDGGSTSRSNVSGEWHRTEGDHSTRMAAYVMRYRLQLFSNVTYALDRPEEGDQFSQRDSRRVAGYSASHSVGHLVGAWPTRSEVGLQLRHDKARVGLFDTVQRRVTATTRDDTLRETLAVTGGRIPNAVDRVASLALTARKLDPWSASVQWRYLGSGALVEDNSQRSTASLTTNLRLACTLPAWAGRGSELTLDVFNLTDRRVNDIQYHYPSRLPGEADAVADRHVHPAEPRTLRLALRLGF